MSHRFFGLDKSVSPSSSAVVAASCGYKHASLKLAAIYMYLCSIFISRLCLMCMLFFMNVCCFSPCKSCPLLIKIFDDTPALFLRLFRMLSFAEGGGGGEEGSP